MTKIYSLKDVTDKINVSIDHNEIFSFNKDKKLFNQNMFNILTKNYKENNDFNINLKNTQMEFFYIHDQKKKVMHINIFDILFLLRPDVKKEWINKILEEVNFLDAKLGDDFSNEDFESIVKENMQDVLLIAKINKQKNLRNLILKEMYNEIDSMFSILFCKLAKYTVIESELLNKNIKYLLNNNGEKNGVVLSAILNERNVMMINKENIDINLINILIQLNLLKKEKTVKVDNRGSIKRNKSGVISINLNENIFLKTGENVEVLDKYGVHVRSSVIDKLINDMKDSIEKNKNKGDSFIKNIRQNIAFIEKSLIAIFINDEKIPNKNKLTNKRL